MLGIDEHTGVVIDVESGDVEIVGRGRVTVRTHSSSTEFRSGDALTVTRIAEIAGSGERAVSVTVPSDGVDAAGIAASLAAGDVEAAVTGLLLLQADPEADSRSVGALIAALGERAANAPVDRESIVGPYVALLLEMRMAARAEKRFADSDLIRDRLAEAGVTIRDTPTGPEWDLT